MVGSRVRKVVIVGGGIAGPVLGMWLRRLGVEVVLLEARPAAASGEGAFLGVAPNGMNVLAALGVADAVARRGAACHAFTFSNPRGRSLGRIDRSGDAAQFGHPLTMVRRGALHAVLAEEAVRCGVDLRYGKRLAELERAADGVVARCDDGSEVRGDLLVGCDGLRSRVRERLMPQAPGPCFTGLIDCGGFARVEGLPVRAGQNEMVFGRHAFFGAFVTPDAETWWFHNGPPPAAGQALPTGEALRERLLHLHREDPAWISDVLRATPRLLGPWPLFEAPVLPRWSEGRVCLIGDAAHAMPPSAGQGASLAMEDAMVLARCLRDVAEPARALQTFERLRRPRVDAILQHARRNGSGKAPGSALSAWVRDRALPLALRFGGAAQTRSYAYREHWEERAA